MDVFVPRCECIHVYMYMNVLWEIMCGYECPLAALLVSLPCLEEL